MKFLFFSFRVQPLVKLTLAITIFLLSSACKKDKNKEDELPAITQQGLGTFGCKINGKIFIPEKRGISDPGQSLYVNYGQSPSFTFSLSASNSKDPVEAVRFFAEGINLSAGKYQLTDNNQNAVAAIYENFSTLDDSRTYKVTLPLTGELNISYLDQTKKIISATFWFDAVNNKGQKVEVREGRFDVKYN